MELYYKCIQVGSGLTQTICLCDSNSNNVLVQGRIINIMAPRHLVSIVQILPGRPFLDYCVRTDFTNTYLFKGWKSFANHPGDNELKGRFV